MGDAMYATGRVYVIRFLSGNYYSGYKGITDRINHAKLFVDINQALAVAKKYEEQEGAFRIYEGFLNLYRVVGDKNGIKPCAYKPGRRDH